MQENTCRLAI